MISAEDLIAEEAEAEDDLERIIEGDEEENGEHDVNPENGDENNVNQDGDDDNDQGNQDDKEKKKKRVVRNPQPKLDAEALKKPRGLLCLESLFDRVKFKGKGYEEHDLNVLMKTYEYWCHRLFPKYPFDDCIAKLEKLGTKKPVKNFLRRIQLDMLTDSDERPEMINDDDTQQAVEDAAEVEDQFDNLLSQPLPSNTESLPTNEVEPFEWTEEQLRRMQENKERAEKKKLERLRQIQEKAASVMERSQNRQNSVNNGESFSQNSVMDIVNNEQDGNNSRKVDANGLVDGEIEDREVQNNDETEGFSQDGIVFSQNEDGSSEFDYLKSCDSSSYNNSQNKLSNNQVTLAQKPCDNLMDVDEDEIIENYGHLYQTSNVINTEEDMVKESDRNQENINSQVEESDDSTEIYHRSSVSVQQNDLDSHDKT